MVEKSKVDSEEILRSRMRKYVHKNFMGDYRAVANVFQTTHGKKVSIRTIQSWLIESNRKSSRKCPEWAVKTISDFINNNPDYFERLNEYNKNLYSDNKNHRKLQKYRVLDQCEVELAENKIQCDENRKKKWINASIGELSMLIYDLESRLDGYVQYHNTLLTQIISSLREEKSFEEFRSDLLSSISYEKSKDFALHKTAKDILEKNEEFSDDFGLLNQD